MEQAIKDTITQIHSTERYTDANKSAWRNLFQLAKVRASQLKLQTKFNKYRQSPVVPRDNNDDLLVRQIVDNWMAYDNTANITHSHPDDAQVADDQSCMQAMVNQQKQFLQDILELLIKVTDTTARDRLWHLYDQEVNTNLSATDYAAYAEFGDASEFYEFRDQSHHDRHVAQQEYRDNPKLATGPDPDDNRYTGTVPKRDMDGHITFDAKMSSDYVDNLRGTQGVLSGLYTNSYPEPTYYTKDQKRRLRSTLLDSNNPDDIKLATYMTPMKAGRRLQVIRRRKENLDPYQAKQRRVFCQRKQRELSNEEIAELTTKREV